MKKQKVYLVMHELRLMKNASCHGRYVKGIYSSLKKAQSELDEWFEFAEAQNKKSIEREEMAVRYQSIDLNGNWWKHEYTIKIKEVK